MPPARPRSSPATDRGRDGWGSLFRVTACCALVSLGVMTALPKARGGVGAGAGEEASPSALFEDVRIPADYVPVSLGRTIGSVVPGSYLDVQVCKCNKTRERFLGMEGGGRGEGVLVGAGVIQVVPQRWAL